MIIVVIVSGVCVCVWLDLYANTSDLSTSAVGAHKPSKHLAQQRLQCKYVDFVAGLN